MEGPVIPFANLAREIGHLRPRLDAAMARVVERGSFVLGEELEGFESEFAEWLGTSHAVGVASGTDAIELALRALGVGPGDEVITQANTCVPTAAAIERSGATPVLCDVEAEAGTMDPASFEAAITERTAAVVVVHLYGQCADLAAIGAIARRHGLALVEDCAQATGASIDGVPAGRTGAAGCFSFYPTKNLAAFGDAGAVVTDDAHLAARLGRLRQYGRTDLGAHLERGVNSRMDELQAGVLRIKLTELDRRNDRRRLIASRYSLALDGTCVAPLAARPGCLHAYHQFVVRVGERDRFRELMAERGIETMIHYPEPVHAHAAYAGLARNVPLAVSEELCREIASLPIYPELDADEIEAVATAARDSANALSRWPRDAPEPTAPYVQ
jgi:dTDP-4-amino-4,6-dideoxygalactose transaminase